MRRGAAAWGPLRTAITYAVAGPVIGLALFVLTFTMAGAVNIEGALAVPDLLFGAYVIGLPAMAATGFLVAVAARNGRRLPRLTLTSAFLGFAFAALSGVLWMLLGASPTTAVSWPLVLGIALMGAAAGFACALLAAVVARLEPTR